MTTFADGLFQYGGMPVGGSFPQVEGAYYFVDPVSGSNANVGTNASKPLATIQKAVDLIASHDQTNCCIMLAPGQYDETVTIERSDTNNLTIFGTGGRGAAYIEPSTTNANGMVNDTDDLTLINVGIAGDGTGIALTNTGTRLRTYGCKIEGGAGGLLATLGSVATEAAGTKGRGADCWHFGSEFAYSTAYGVKFNATDYGGVTQQYFIDCLFHDLTAASFEEGNTGGSAAVQWFDVLIKGCTFMKMEDGTNPTKWLSLNDNNANTGVLAGCFFPVAVNSGLNLVSTAMVSVGNFFTGGISTGQPS